MFLKIHLISPCWASSNEASVLLFCCKIILCIYSSFRQEIPVEKLASFLRTTSSFLTNQTASPSTMEKSPSTMLKPVLWRAVVVMRQRLLAEGLGHSPRGWSQRRLVQGEDPERGLRHIALLITRCSRRQWEMHRHLQVVQCRIL